MSDEKLSYEELQTIFGPKIPMAAVSYLGFAHGNMTFADLRQQLTGMGFLWKDLCKQQNILEPENAYPPFINDGSLVKRLRDNKPFFIAESDLQAAQFVLLLNMGHIEYAKQIQKERLMSPSNGAAS